MWEGQSPELGGRTKEIDPAAAIFAPYFAAERAADPVGHGEAPESRVVRFSRGDIDRLHFRHGLEDNLRGRMTS